MNSRDTILAQVKANKPTLSIFDGIPQFEGDCSLAMFKQSIELSGGKLIEMNSIKDTEKIILELFPSAKQIASNIIVGTVSVNSSTNSIVLQQMDVAVLHSKLGVAENGAIWLTEDDMLHRTLPFIAQHLVVVLKKEMIVSNMHHAYSKVVPSAYDVFISGPSKTADIEQSLVIGAQGPRSLTILAYQE